MALASLNFLFRADTTNFNRKLHESKKEVSSLSASLGNITKIAAGMFAFDRIGGAIRAISDTTAEFQKYSAVLENTLGSQEKANAQLGMLKKFSADTPFQLNELTESFVKLANRGFIPSQKELRKLGDLASSTGKSFDQLTEAMLDAETGEFERLKEFGIKAKTEGDKITFTFKNQQTTVEKSAGAIRQYILSLGDLMGVTGSMEKISQTLGGRLSNLKDQFDLIKLSVGTALMPVFEKVIGLAQKFAEKLTSLTTEQVENRLKLIALTGAFIAVAPALTNVLLILPKVTTAIKAMTIAISANPIGALVALLSAAGVALGIEFIPKLLRSKEALGKTAMSVEEMKLQLSELTDQQLAAKEVGLLSVDTEDSKKWLEATRQVIAERQKAKEEADKANAAASKTIGIIVRLNEEIKKNNELIDKSNSRAEIARLTEKNIGLEEQIRLTKELGDEYKKLDAPSMEKENKKFDKQLDKKYQDPPKKLAPNHIKVLPGIDIDTDVIVGYVTEMDNAIKKTIEFSETVSAAFNNLGSQISQGANSWEEYGQVVKQAITQTISMIIKEGVALAVANALKTASITGPAALAIAPIMGGLAAGIFNTAINSVSPPKLAGGGLAYAPTLAVVGDNKNAQIDPEVIAPLSKLQGMMSVNVTGHSVIRGKDIYTIWTRENDFITRTSGIR